MLGQEARGSGGDVTGWMPSYPHPGKKHPAESVSCGQSTALSLHVLTLRVLVFGPQNALSGLDAPAAAVGVHLVADPAAETPVSHRFHQIKEWLGPPWELFPPFAFFETLPQ